MGIKTRPTQLFHDFQLRLKLFSFSSQVNGVSVEGKTHSEVVAAIKVGGNVAHLLVVDSETDAFFKQCGVIPTSDHLNGETTGLFSSLVWQYFPTGCVTLFETQDVVWLFWLPLPRSSDGG